MVFLLPNEELVFGFGDFKENRKLESVFKELAQSHIVTKGVELEGYVERWAGGASYLDVSPSPKVMLKGDIWAVKKDKIPVLDWYFGVLKGKSRRIIVNPVNYHGVIAYVHNIPFEK